MTSSLERAGNVESERRFTKILFGSFSLLFYSSSFTEDETARNAEEERKCSVLKHVLLIDLSAKIKHTARSSLQHRPAHPCVVHLPPSSHSAWIVLRFAGWQRRLILFP